MIASDEKGLIFNIQRYSLHDGSGIRTIVFLKGCPLKCPWCCNPESKGYKPEIGKINSKCINCKSCCNNPIECPTDALVQFGTYMTVDEVIQEVLKDSLFYQTSGGGVTLSGGEVLAQVDFAATLLKKLKGLFINTAVETCGMSGVNNDTNSGAHSGTNSIMKLADYTDEFLFDLKIMDRSKSMNILGANIDNIISNLRQLVAMGKKVTPRIPFIPGYTSDDKNLHLIASLLKELGLKEVHLLPFHQYGSGKYEYLNADYACRDIIIPSEEMINAGKALLKAMASRLQSVECN